MNSLVFFLLALIVGSFGAICGNDILEGSEHCDGGLGCQADCTCPAGLSPTNVTLGAMYAGCDCTPPLAVLSGHWFSSPPNISASIDTLTGDLTATITLPQTRPLRSKVAANYVFPINGSSLPSGPASFTVTDAGCYYQLSSVNTVSNLIHECAPEVYQTATAWELVFGIKVTWSEPVQLTKKDQTYFVNRTMEAKQSLRLIINRFATANSTILIMSSGVVWAYYMKSYVFINPLGVSYIDFQVMTHTKSDGMMIDPNSFIVLNHTGTLIAGITNFTLMQNETTLGEMQLWKFRVTVANGICTSLITDNFTVQYTLVGSTATYPFVPDTHTMVMTLSKLENWCAVNLTEIGLNAVQTTYMDSGFLDTATRFFLQDIVYVLVQVWPDITVDLKSTTLETVGITGSAVPGPLLAIGNPYILYNNPTVMDIAFALTTTNLPANPCQLPNSTCYFFTLPPNLIVNSPLTIRSTVSIELAGTKRRTITMEKTTSFSRLAVLKGKAQKPTITTPAIAPAKEQAAAEKPTVVVYQATPGLIASVATVVTVSLASISIFIYIVLSARKN